MKRTILLLLSGVLLVLISACSGVDLPIYTIGDTGPGGGIVFYITAGGTHGLEASPDDQSTGILWFKSMSSGTFATGIIIGTGSSNTASTVAAQGDGSYAAKLCYDLELNGYGDWFLPSKDELSEMFWEKGVIGGFDSTAHYWSSSEFGNGEVWEMEFLLGTQSHSTGWSTTYKVRAIRAF